MSGHHQTLCMSASYSALFQKKSVMKKYRSALTDPNFHCILDFFELIDLFSSKTVLHPRSKTSFKRTHWSSQTVAKTSWYNLWDMSFSGRRESGWYQRVADPTIVKRKDVLLLSFGESRRLPDWLLKQWWKINRNLITPPQWSYTHVMR